MTNQQLSSIIDALRAEKSLHTPSARPAGKCCKYCHTMLAVVVEEPTIVHVRDTLSQSVQVKCLYHGKHYCKMCHKYQA
jgi:hypothetical protein